MKRTSQVCRRLWKDQLKVSQVQLFERKERAASLSLLQHLTACHHLLFTQMYNYWQVCHAELVIAGGTHVRWLNGQSKSSPIFLLSEVTESLDAYYMPFVICAQETSKENCIVHCSLCSSASSFFFLHLVSPTECPVFFHSQSFHKLAGCKSE